jgi:hypothetical protein
MDKPNFVNIGTPERPILVSDEALKPETSEGREWWERVANGDLRVEDKALNILCGLPKDEEV